MSILIERRQELVVVDSRSVAVELGLDHNDYMNNVIYKHQTVVEQAFGVLRFENVKPQAGSLGGRPERYALLTEDQATLLMTFSRNTAKVIKAKVELVKAFSEYKRREREQLERLLTVTPDPELEQLCKRIAELEQEREAIASMTDASRFDFTLKAAVQVSGHRRFYATRTRVLSYLIEGIDYYLDGDEVRLSNPAYYSFVAASRTTDGIDISVLQNFVHLRWDFYCRMCQAVRKPVNALYAQKRRVDKQMYSENKLTIPGFSS